MSEHKVVKFHAFPGDISIKAKIALKNETAKGRSFRSELVRRSKKRQRRRDKDRISESLAEDGIQEGRWYRVRVWGYPGEHTRVGRVISGRKENPDGYYYQIEFCGYGLYYWEGVEEEFILEEVPGPPTP